MNTFVIDASVAIKWFLPEVHSDKARLYLSGSNTLLVPEFIETEIGNIIWKKVRGKLFNADRGAFLLAQFKRLPLSIFMSRLLTHAAFYIAVEHDRTFYDSVYLALAVSQKCQLVTADEKFYNALRSTKFRRHVRWVAEPIK